MIAQHRLIGNIPGRGHGDPLLSLAFPLDSELATAAAYRMPDPGFVPAQAARRSEDGGFLILVTTFELQAVHFGRPLLLSSNVFRRADASTRPSMYMSTVALTDDSGAPLTFPPLDALLGFDGFVRPAQFAGLSATSKTLPAVPYTPGPAPARKPFFSPKTPAHRALLGLYWAAASARFFPVLPGLDSSGGVFSVCLGQQTGCPEIMEGAKALLSCDILPYLPPAVRHIASISACTLVSSVHSVFKDTALAVVFPTAPDEANQPTFDLRRPDGYPSLAPQQDRFISSMLEGKNAFFDDAVSRYMALSGCQDASRVPFAADYDFAFLLYQLESGVLRGEGDLSASQYIAAWRQINALLLMRHRLSNTQANAVLEGVEAQLMGAFARSKALLDAVDAASLPAFWQKALTVSDGLFDAYGSVIAGSPAAMEFPKMVAAFSGIGEKEQRRNAQLIDRILGAADAPLGAELVSQLMDDAFTSVADGQPPVMQALAESLRRNNAAFPDNLLVTLPLSCRLLDGTQAVSDAVELLHAKFLRALPAQPLLDHLRDAVARFPNGAKRLAAYFAACLPAQAGNIEALAAAAASILPSADEALRGMLERAAQCGLMLNAGQLKALLGALLPRCAHPAALGPVYAAYEASTGASMPSAERLDRLCAVAPHLRAMAYDATDISTALFAGFSETRLLLPAERAEAFADRLWPLCADQARVTAAFQSYLTDIVRDDPLNYIRSVENLHSLTPFMRAAGMDMTQAVCDVLSAISESAVCVPIDELAAFGRELFPQCRDTSGVTEALLRYADTVASVLLTKGVCDFAWFDGLESVMEPCGLLSESARASLAGVTVRHLLATCELPSFTPGEPMFAWMEGACAHPTALANIQTDVLTLFERLLSGPRASAARQGFARLRRFFPLVTAYPNLKRCCQRMACDDFVAALASSPCAKALSSIRPDMRRCALSEQELLAQTREKALDALRRELPPLHTPKDFELALRQAEPDAGLEQLRKQALSAAFAQQYPAFQKGCKTVEELSRLNGLATRLGISGKQAGSLLDNVSRLVQTAAGPNFSAADFDVCMRALRESGDLAPSVCRMLSSSLAGQISGLRFPKKVWSAMLCAYLPKADTFDWPRVLALMDCGVQGFAAGEKLPAPYSVQGQRLLAALHALCRALDPLAPQYGARLLRFLQSEPLSAFADEVLADKKRLQYFFHEPQSALLRRWLGL